MQIKSKLNNLSPPAKIWSQVLDFSLTAITLPGKNKDYTGPKTHDEICKQIAIDAAAKGIDVSDNMSDRVVRRFFQRLVRYMVLGYTIIIDDFGTFGMSGHEKKMRIKRYNEKHYAKYLRHKKANYRRNYNKDIKHAFRKFNADKIERGLKEWKFKEWARVFKIRRIKRMRKEKRPFITK